jgi:hypothetical protein
MEQEYKRFLVTRSLIELFNSSTWHVFLEQLLINMSLYDDPARIDPVYVELDPDHKLIRSIDQLDMPLDHINKAKIELINAADQMLTWIKSNNNSTERVIHVHKGSKVVTLAYGQMIIKLSIDFFDMLEHAHKSDPADFIRNLTKAALRYRSIVNDHSQLCLHYSYYKCLYLMGYRYELASPFNFMFGLTEYKLTGKISSVGFYSLFMDTDKHFGAIGTLHTGFIPINGTLYNTVGLNTIAYEALTFNTRSMIITDQSLILTKADWQHQISQLVYTNNTKYGIPINQVNMSANIYASQADINQLLAIKPAELLAIRMQTNSLALSKEWHRLKYIDQLKQLNSTQAYLDLLIEFLYEMVISNKHQADQVLCNYDIDHNIYTVLRSKLLSHDLPDYTSNIRLIIANYFANTIQPIEIIYHMHDNHVRFEANNTSRTIYLDSSIRSALLFKSFEINNNSDHELNLAVCLLRYESLIGIKQLELPFDYSKQLYKKYKIRFEGFCQPMTSQFIMLDYIYQRNEVRFCSLFYDTDQHFGSIGYIDKLITHPMYMVKQSEFLMSLIVPEIHSIKELIVLKLVEFNVISKCLMFVHYKKTTPDTIENQLMHITYKKLWIQEHLHYKDLKSRSAGLHIALIVNNQQEHEFDPLMKLLI